MKERPGIEQALDLGGDAGFRRIKRLRVEPVAEEQPLRRVVRTLAQPDQIAVALVVHEALQVEQRAAAALQQHADGGDQQRLHLQGERGVAEDLLECLEHRLRGDVDGLRAGVAQLERVDGRHAAADAVEIRVDVDQPVALAVFFEAGDFLREVAVRIDDDNRGRPRFTEVAIDQQLQELALTAAALAQNVGVALPVAFRHQHRQACKKKAGQVGSRRRSIRQLARPSSVSAVERMPGVGVRRAMCEGQKEVVFGVTPLPQPSG